MIIGLGNKARQGKDEIASILSREYGFLVVHFADPLKLECAQAWGWNEHHKNIMAHQAIPSMRGGLLDKNGKFHRFGDNSLLQFWGSFRRAEDKDYWVKAAFRNLHSDKIVVADLRHLNEAEYIKSRGGLTVRVQRVMNGCQFISNDRDPSHQSEVELDGYQFDFNIVCEDIVDPKIRRRHQETEVKKLIDYINKEMC